MTNNKPKDLQISHELIKVVIDSRHSQHRLRTARRGEALGAPAAVAGQALLAESGGRRRDTAGEPGLRKGKGKKTRRSGINQENYPKNKGGKELAGFRIHYRIY